MSNTQPQSVFSKRKPLFLLLCLPMVLLFAVVQMLAAQDIVEPFGEPPNVTAAKSVSSDEVISGQSVQYTIVVSNTGGVSASGVLLTDTLPTEFNYVSGTLSSQTSNALEDTLDVVDNVVMWEGSLGSNDGMVEIEFQATLTDTAVVGEFITNTAQVTGGGSLLTPTAAIEVISAPPTTTVYLPIAAKSLPSPNLISAGDPTSDNTFVTYNILVTWADLGLAGGTYELQTSKSPDFTDPTLYDAGSATSYSVPHVSSTSNLQNYYRVRFLKDGQIGPWSNVVTQFGAYTDSFNDSSSGWSIRRHDTDDTNDSVSYTNGKLKLKVGGRWDSIIASPMIPTPNTWSKGYRIDTYVQLGDGIDNLHTYGIVFGGDWDGATPCPAPNLLSCFNQYYRLNLIWSGHHSQFVGSLKRIDSHDPPNNSDKNFVLMSTRDVYVGDTGGWNKWTIDVFSDGSIRMFVNGNQFWSGQDQRYVGGTRYFGAFASANEYLGSAPYYEYFTVSPIP